MRHAAMRLDLFAASRGGEITLTETDTLAIKLAADVVLARDQLSLSPEDRRLARHGAVLLSELFRLAEGRVQYD